MHNIRELAHQVGTYGAAVGLALATDEGLEGQLDPAELAVFMALGLQADLALRTGNDYGAIADLRTGPRHRQGRLDA